MADRRPRSRSRRAHSPSARPNGTAPSTATAAPADLPPAAEAVVDTRSFVELGVPAGIARTLAAAGIADPFPIQSATLPDSLAGRDVLGRGRTGSGKTLAFAIPLVARLAAAPEANRKGTPPRALILAPTRELATQIAETVSMLATPLGLRTVTVFGGVSAGPQSSAFRRGVDIVIACPGRLEDHLGQGNLTLDFVEVTVLDEADHMADLGFLPGVKRIMDRTPKDGQRLLFSATLDGGIDVLVRRYLHDPVTHSVDSAQSPVDAMEHHVLHVEADQRLAVIADLASAPGRTMVFTRTKHRARTLTRQLVAKGVPTVEMHGNLTQQARVRNLAAFSEGRAVALVATDIAARGIHVDDVALVVHADPPVEHKAYLHRSGRTARAGNDGTVITLATPDQRRDVEQLTRKAGVSPTVTRVAVGDALLTELAPGTRQFLDDREMAEALRTPATTQARPAGQPGSGRRRGPKSGAAKSGSAGAKSGGAKSGAAKSGGQRSGGARNGGGRRPSR